MANYTPANLVKAQLMLNGEFAKNDNRFRRPDVFLMFLGSNNSFFPNYKTLKTSDTRVLEANYFKRTAQSLTTTGRAHNHTGSGGDSGTMTLAWVTYSTTFSMTLKQADTSILTWQNEFNNEITQKIIDFSDGLDTVAVNYLFSNRSGVNPAAVKGTFDGTNDVYEIPQTNYGTQGMTITKIVMDINKYQGQRMMVVADSIAWSDFLQQAAQGAQNATNQAFQFMGIDFIHNPSLTATAAALDATYTKGFWLVVPKDYVGCLDWIPKQNKKGEVTTVSMYASIMNPNDGLQYAFHSYETRVDGTGVNGQKQDVKTESELSIDLAFSHAPSSTANSTPIFAFAFV